MWMFVLLCIGCSVVASIIVTKILATHYFEIVDGYVSDMVDLIKQKMEEIVLDQDKS